MSTLPRLAATLVLLVGGLAACGDDDGVTTAPPPTTAAPATAPPLTTAPAASAPATTASPEQTQATTVTTATTANPPTTEPADERTAIEVTVRGGEVEGGGRHKVALGAEIRIVVHADVADEVHVHGYDVTAYVAPGTPAVLEMTADIPGIFEVELESAHIRILELEVAP